MTKKAPAKKATLKPVTTHSPKKRRTPIMSTREPAKQIVETVDDESVRDEPVSEPEPTPEPAAPSTPDVPVAPEAPAAAPMQEYPRLMWHKRTGEEITVHSAPDAQAHADDYQDTPVAPSSMVQRVRES